MDASEAVSYTHLDVYKRQSLPISIQDAPAGTVSYAIVLEDKDAYPVSGGFVWIHWTVANLTRTELEENESVSATDFVQGANSWMSVQGGQQSRKMCIRDRFSTVP